MSARIARILSMFSTVILGPVSVVDLYFETFIIMIVCGLKFKEVWI
jgi:hypothetical protein